ncbi:hypothetical protein ACHAQJ_009704 [Trichoderma viride]
MAPKEGIVFDDIGLKDSNGSLWTLYGQSKLANILHAMEISRRYGAGDHPILGISVDPGMVKTNLTRSPTQSLWWFRLVQPLIQLRAPNARLGAYTQIYAAASSDIKITDNGSYFMPGPRKEKLSALAQNVQLAKRLWEWTDRQLSIKGFA